MPHFDSQNYSIYVVDNLGLLPLVVANKNLLVNVIAPLAIEPAPILLPALVSILKIPPSNFLGAGVALLGAGLYESTDNILLALPLLLLGVPVAGLGALLSGSVPLPTAAASPVAASVSAAPKTSVVASSGRPVAGKKPAAPAPVKVEKVAVTAQKAPASPAVAKKAAAAAPVVSAKKATVAPVQRVRKTVKVNSR